MLLSVILIPRVETSWSHGWKRDGGGELWGEISCTCLWKAVSFSGPDLNFRAEWRLRFLCRPPLRPVKSSSEQFIPVAFSRGPCFLGQPSRNHTWVPGHHTFPTSESTSLTHPMKQTSAAPPPVPGCFCRVCAFDLDPWRYRSRATPALAWNHRSTPFGWSHLWRVVLYSILQSLLVVETLFPPTEVPSTPRSCFICC